MAKQTIIVGTDVIMSAVRALYERGEITTEQYTECQRRAADSNDKENTIIEVTDEWEQT